MLAFYFFYKQTHTAQVTGKKEAFRFLHISISESHRWGCQERTRCRSTWADGSGAPEGMDHSSPLHTPRTHTHTHTLPPSYYTVHTDG